MKKSFLIPGLGTTEEFYAGFLKQMPDLIFLPNTSFTYSEFDNLLQSKIKTGEKIHLYGWSLGSLFALRWAIENPASLSALFLTGATARFCGTETYRNGVREKTLTMMIRQCHQDPQRVIDNFFRSMLESSAETENHLAVLRRNCPPAESFLNGLQELQDTDLLNKANRITVPTRIVQGVEDRITPLAGARVLHTLLPDGMLYEQPGGHCLLVEKPEVCARLFRESIQD